LTLTVSEWAERTGISRITLAGRLKRGWSIEKTLTQPVTRSRPHNTATDRQVTDPHG
jgi:hypothetical protein